jgi:hypothetical protein
MSAGYSGLVQRCRSGWAAVLPWLQLLWRVRLPLLLAMVIAVVCGVLGFVGGPWVAAIGLGLGGFALTLQGLLAWAVWTSLPKVESLPWLKRTTGTRAVTRCRPHRLAEQKNTNPSGPPG